MKLNQKRNFIIVALINLIIAAGFFLDNLDSGYSILINDVHSIIGIGHKFDDTSLFKTDLFLNTKSNVEYYTPFFVQPMRFFAKLMSYNYLQGLNLFGFFSNLFFGILWFLLFSKFSKNFWIALFLSILVRGIVWLPGGEIWGIGELWSIMPRTIYITFMPLPFLFLQAYNKPKLLVSAFLIGLVFNFHPISGLGGIILFLSICFLYYMFYKPNIKKPILTFFLIITMIILGMLPFIITYFTQTDSTFNYDINLYEEAFAKRIPGYFENPPEFLSLWFKPGLLAFFVILVSYLIVSRKNSSELKKASILIISSIILLLTANIAVYVEDFVNSVTGLNLRMAFQFIRLQKLAILPAYFAIAFMLVKLLKYKKRFPLVFGIFFGALLICKSPIFHKVPVLSNDILRTILPKSLSILKDGRRNYKEIDEMMDYIVANTEEDAVFIGPPLIRSATKRSVKLDYKGASAIIEGNPSQFIQWYQDRTKFEKLNEIEQIQFLRNIGVNYILVPVKKEYDLELVHQIDKWHLYKVK